LPRRLGGGGVDLLGFRTRKIRKKFQMQVVNTQSFMEMQGKSFPYVTKYVIILVDNR
jgi:hypothetical protein